jgi:hypothetical protein
LALLIKRILEVETLPCQDNGMAHADHRFHRGREVIRKIVEHLKQAFSTFPSSTV